MALRAASPVGPSQVAMAFALRRFVMITGGTYSLAVGRARLSRLMADDDADLLDRARKAAELLELLGKDLRGLAKLDEPLRIRLVAAAGGMARPARSRRK